MKSILHSMAAYWDINFIVLLYIPSG